MAAGGFNSLRQLAAVAEHAARADTDQDTASTRSPAAACTSSIPPSRASAADTPAAGALGGIAGRSLTPGQVSLVEVLDGPYSCSDGGVVKCEFRDFVKDLICAGALQTSDKKLPDLSPQDGQGNLGYFTKQHLTTRLATAWGEGQCALAACWSLKAPNEVRLRVPSSLARAVPSPLARWCSGLCLLVCLVGLVYAVRPVTAVFPPTGLFWLAARARAAAHFKVPCRSRCAAHKTCFCTCCGFALAGTMAHAATSMRRRRCLRSCGKKSPTSICIAWSTAPRPQQHWGLGVANCPRV